MTGDRIETLIDELNVTSPEYAKLASSLSDGIARLEQFLDSLPGKIETTVSSGGFSESNDLMLRFTRSKQSWIIEVGEFVLGPNDEPCRKWSLLRESPLELKIQASPLIRQLLTAMINEQNDRLQKLKQVVPLIESLKPLIEKGGER